MELRWPLCGAVLAALLVAGSNAQLDVCGVSEYNHRIVGGGNAPAGAWPWYAALVYNNVVRCGGSLINDQYILTAAQCVHGISSTGIKVWLGAATLDNNDPNRVIRAVSIIIMHPSYYKNKLDDDIALLKLSSPVTFNNYIRPVCLAKSSSRYESGYCWATGFGKIGTNTPLPSPRNLQEVLVPIVSNSKCQQTFSNQISQNILCAGGEGRGICNDAGAPLVSKNTNENKWVQGGLGIFRGKSGCAQSKIPDGYTRVSRYEDWIKSHIDSNQPGFINAAGTSALSLPLLLLLLSSSIF